MQVPDNYYVDLDARFALPRDAARPTCASTTCSTTGSATASCCTPTPTCCPTGFYVELLERRGGYDGYGSANTHVRLAMQTP